MKIRFLASLALLSAAAVSVANAQTDIRFTGSTAYRANVHAAIQAILDPGFTVADSGSTVGGSTFANFTGTFLTGGVHQPVVVRTSWSGSEAGIQTVAAQLHVNFLPINAVGTNLGNGAATDSQVPNVAMSDTFQSTSQFRPPAFAQLDEAIAGGLGVVPFKWLANNGAPFTNITAQLCRAVYTTVGAAPLALFTGNHADQGTVVYGTGRNPDSGTRLTTFAETGVGATSAVNQYQPTKNSGAQAPASSAGGALDDPTAFGPGLWPADNVNGIPIAVGNSGYSSGGTLALAMANSSTGFFYVAYLGINDANGVIPGGANAAGKPAVELAYNGVTLGGTSATDYNTVTVLTEGLYTFWGYEHMYWLHAFTTAGGTPKALATAVANNLLSTNAQVKLSSMQVSRGSDGGTVTATYF